MVHVFQNLFIFYEFLFRSVAKNQRHSDELKLNVVHATCLGNAGVALGGIAWVAIAFSQRLFFKWTGKIMSDKRKGHAITRVKVNTEITPK